MKQTTTELLNISANLLLFQNKNLEIAIKLLKKLLIKMIKLKKKSSRKLHFNKNLFLFYSVKINTMRCLRHSKFARKAKVIYHVVATARMMSVFHTDMFLLYDI